MFRDSGRVSYTFRWLRTFRTNFVGSGRVSYVPGGLRTFRCAFRMFKAEVGEFRTFSPGYTDIPTN